MNKPRCFLAAATAFIAALSACANDGSTAGTAVEPNQNPIAFETSSASVDVLPSSGGISSSSVEEISSTSILPQSSSDGSSATASQSSSSIAPASSGEIISPGSSSSDISDTQPPSSNQDRADSNASLDAFILQYGDTSIHFDEHVLAYNLVNLDRCVDAENCEDTAPIYAEYRSAGFYENVNRDVVETLFPMTSSTLMTRNDVECQLHLLNIEEESTNGFVLTKISKDTLTVVDMEANYCETDKRKKVFGILFQYCGEFSKSLAIEHQKTSTSQDEACKTINYSTEWVSKQLL